MEYKILTAENECRLGTKIKRAFVDFGRGVTFESESTNYEDAFEAILNQIRGYFNNGGKIN